MGMELKPMRPSKDAPRDRHGTVWGRYNWMGWGLLVEYLDAWGVNTEPLRFANDGNLIPAKKCREIADAIEAHLPELYAEHQQWLRPHIVLWRTCGGYRQL